MESASRFITRFEEDDDGEEEIGKRESSTQKEPALEIDGKSNEQKVRTPRSKHSATEQRRRSKINDRFQILRGLLPNSDKKRDKASFLLEVIEYIQFLQEKVQKYEFIYPGWGDENTRLMPQNNHHGSCNAMDDHHVLKLGAACGLLVSDNCIPATENVSAFANKVVATPDPLQPNLQRFIQVADNMVSQSEWLRPSFPVDCTISNEVINEEEELIVDDGTIRASTEYSQGILNSLYQAMQNSGIGLSQVSISVHISLARTGNRYDASPSMATAKSQHGSGTVTKRRKSDHC